ncbi:PAS domain S-box protein [Planktothrix sp. FACHB-1365]|uniref:PAS domain S-box protein n=1 Tax=Planktothrix sp. FACHB-1365 TaxID=2692855 RepID=UPI00168648DD|nr:PAS domain S-box protein [Planktothrix sp. FACHB-1365]MBD2482092.1 PAS domain S-box protein [Planktothrix sp. FACHB-1365]
MITLSPDLQATESSILTLLSISLDYLTDACVWLTKEARIQGYNTAFKELVLDYKDNHLVELDSLVDLPLNDCLPLTQNGNPISISAYPNPEIQKGNSCPINYELQRGEELFFLRISGKVLNLQGQEIIILWIRNITSLKNLEFQYQQKEQSLRQTEAVLRATLEATADGILVVGEDCDVPVYNQKFLDIWSMPEVLMQPNRNQERVKFAAEKTLDPVGFINRIKNFSTQPSQNVILDRIELKDGRIFQRYGQLQWQGDRIMGRVFSFRDITQQIKIEKSLRESEEQLRTLINATPDIICFKDGEGHWLESNQANLNFLELENVPYQGKTDLELAELKPNYREALLHCQATDEQAWQNAGIYRIEEKVLRSDGHLTIWDMIKVPLFEQDGKRKGLVVLGRDITHQKRAEADLKASEEKFRRIVETAHDIIYLMNGEGILLYIAPNLLTLTGYFPHELEGQLFTLFIHPEDISKTFTVFQTVITSGKQQFDIEFRVKHQDGTWNWYSANWSVSQDAQGDQLVVGVSRNINERRRLENEFISLVSHELRTPLTSLVGGLDLLASGQLGLLTEQGKNLLSIAINNTERLIRLVNNILDLERMKSGKISLQKVNCNLANLMIKAQEAMQVMADQAQIEFEVDPFDYYLWVDPDRIIQILTNLLSNAIKFSEPKQKVWMTAEVIKLQENGSTIPYICLQVKDQGRGIPADKLQIIFERFEQVDASDSRTKGGTGLGLAICRLMVEQHQGKIWAESHLGQGSIFYVMLPIC